MSLLSKSSPVQGLVGAVCVLAALVASAAAAPAAPPGLDLSTPEFRAIADAYSKGRESAASTRTFALKRLLERGRDDGEEMLKEKRKTQNVKGMAVATAMIQMFESAVTNLEATGAVVLPERSAGNLRRPSPSSGRTNRA